MQALLGRNSNPPQREAGAGNTISHSDSLARTDTGSVVGEGVVFVRLELKRQGEVGRHIVGRKDIEAFICDACALDIRG